MQPKIRPLQLNRSESPVTERVLREPVKIGVGDGLISVGGSPQVISVDSTVARVADAVSLNLNDISQSDDECIWHVGVTESNFIIGTRTDADGTGNNALVINRTGTTVNSITLPSPLISSASGTGISSAIRLQSNNPTLLWNNTDAVANECIWDITTSASGALEFRTRTDAHGTGSTWMQVSRSGTKVTKINLDTISVTINDSEVLTSNDIPSIIQTVVEQVLAQLNAATT